MANLYFYYSSMNSGKSTALLQSSFNYQERGQKTMLFTFHGDTRMGKGLIASRIGLSESAHLFSPNTDILAAVSTELKESPIDCVMVDEAQFLTKMQVRQLTDIVDSLGVPVMAFGLRTDYQGELFEGSKYLLAWSEKLVECKGICFCGRKTTFVVRLDSKGDIVTDGEQVVIGAEDTYASLCRKHYKEAIAGKLSVEKIKVKKVDV